MRTSSCTRLTTPRPIRFAALALAAWATYGIGPASAATFTVGPGVTDSTARTLNAGESGTVANTGRLAISGSATAVTLGATSGTATINNNGTIDQTGTGRAVRNNTSGTPTAIINNNAGALLRAADGDVIRADVAGSNWTITNSGTITSLNASGGGSQAIDFDAITTGTVRIDNLAGGVIQASLADAIRPGTNAVINNAGSIIATPDSAGSSSDGIDSQARSGLQVTNTGLISGRHGITGGAANNSVLFTTTVTNSAGGTIQGVNGAGLNLDGFNARESATIVNNGTITGNGLVDDGDAIDVDGVATITNTGIVRSLNAFSATTPALSEGISVGGGTITNSGTIEGLVAAGNNNAVGRGISLVGVDISSGPLAGTREAIYSNSTITNLSGGLIRGQSDSGIFVGGPASGFSVVINNNAGATVRGGGATAAIQTGADNDTVNNAGVIRADGAGAAINLGAGNNRLNISGGAASVQGDINGGVGGTNSMTIAPGAGNSFAYDGSISNFSLVEVQSGRTTLSGANTYGGTTRVSGGTLALDGANRISSSSVLDLNGGTLELANVLGANGQTFAGLTLSDSSTIDFNSGSITFNGLGAVTAGKTLSALDFYTAYSPTYAFRFLGDYSSNANFLALVAATRFDTTAATYGFDGTYTNVAPVPLPAAVWLMMSGLGMLGAVGRRKAKGVRPPLASRSSAKRARRADFHLAPAIVAR